MSARMDADVQPMVAILPDGATTAPGQAEPDSAPHTNPALTDCLLTRALLAIEDTFSSTSIPDNHDPFGPTNLAAAAPPEQVMKAQKPIQVRTQTSMQQLQSACISMYGKVDGIIIFSYMPGSTGTLIATLTIKIPAGQIRKYVTDVAFEKKTDAREAVCRLALDMGVVDFLQTGNDKKHLDRAKANKDGEHSDGVVSTLGGKVHYFDDDEPFFASRAYIQIEECCQKWRTGKVSPRCLTFTHLQDPRRYGAMLEIRLTPELSNPSVVKVWSTPAEYMLPNKAKIDVAELALKQGVLEFIKFGNGQKKPNEGSQVAIPPLLAVGETFGNPTHVDPLAHPRPSINIRQWVEAMPKPIPNNIKLEDGTNAIAWVNQVSAQNKIPVTYARVYSANGKGVGCILRAAAPDIAHAERSWFVDAMFNSWQEARLAVCFEAVCRGGYDEFMKGTGSALKERMKAQQRKEKQLQQMKKAPPPPPLPPTQKPTPASGVITLATIQEECRKAGLPPPKLEIDKNSHGNVLSATLTINVGEDARLTYTVEGPFTGNVKAEKAVVEKAAKGGLIDFLTPFIGPHAETQQPKPTSNEKGNNNNTDQKSGKKKKKPKKNKTQTDAPTPKTIPSATAASHAHSTGATPHAPSTGATPHAPSTGAIPHAPSTGAASNVSRPLPKHPGPAEPSSPVIWQRPRDSHGESSSSRGGAPLTGANITPLPSRPAHATPVPTLNDSYVPHAQRGPPPPHAHHPPPIRVSGRADEPLPPAPAFRYGPLPEDATERYQGYANGVYYGYDPYRDPMYEGKTFSREPAMTHPPPPPRWESYTDYTPSPMELRGKGKGRTDGTIYRDVAAIDYEEGELMEHDLRYGAAGDDRRWYAGRSYPSYPNDVPNERMRKRSYSGYDEDLYGGPSKKARWSPPIPDMPPPGW